MGRWAGYLALARLSMHTANSFVCPQVHVQERDQLVAKYLAQSVISLFLCSSRSKLVSVSCLKNSNVIWLQSQAWEKMGRPLDWERHRPVDSSLHQGEEVNRACFVGCMLRGVLCGTG